MNLSELLNADMTTLARWSRQGLDWWIGELRTLIPARFAGNADRLRAFHRLEKNGAVHASGNPRADTLVLPGELCFIRHLQLPAMSEADLLSLVTLDADRILPLSAAEIVLGVRKLGPSSTEGLVDVVVGCLPLGRARSVAEALAEQALVPAHVGPLAEDDDQTLAFDLAPGMRKAGLLPQRPAVARAWWIAAAVLLLVNLGIATLREQQQVNHLQEMVDAQSTALGAVRRIEGRLRTNAKSIEQLRARRDHQQPERALAALTRVLPQKCWVQRIEWDGARMRVAGYCAKDVNPVAAVKASGAFAFVRASRAEALAQTFSGTPFDFNASLERTAP
ncbi:hypothetical protein AQZ52_15870 [Novosphingobium fuchskuhlense]|uniref:General secretion pathway protein GspL n=1 Tax=Novosphingobium fuchskuhlense TaxID=1117702 RepID=A0A124JTL8_9SPHN|nr:hypothetical protein AQZ52_15870 [Novosphingobium fuchskuhlense]